MVCYHYNNECQYSIRFNFAGTNLLFISLNCYLLIHILLLLFRLDILLSKWEVKQAYLLVKSLHRTIWTYREIHHLLDQTSKDFSFFCFVSFPWHTRIDLYGVTWLENWFLFNLCCFFFLPWKRLIRPANRLWRTQHCNAYIVRYVWIGWWMHMHIHMCVSWNAKCY